MLKVLRTRLAGDIAVYGVSTLVLQLSRFLTFLYAAKLLGPETWGLWFLLALIVTYGYMSHLGVVNAMNREIPYFRGRGEASAVEKVGAVSFGFMTLTTSVVALLIAIIGLSYSPPVVGYSLVAMALLFFVTQLVSYCDVYWKTNGQFQLAGMFQLLSAFALPAVAIPAASIFGLPGFIVGQGIGSLLGLAIILRFKPISFRFSLDLGEIQRLMRTGLPIMAVGLLYHCFSTVDRWAISSYLGSEALGYYSISIQVVSALSMVPVILGSVFYVRMTEVWGKTKDVSQVVAWGMKQLILSAGTTIVLASVTYVCFPALVHRFMPDYIPGLPTLSFSLAIPVFISLTGCMANALNTLNKQAYYLAAQGISLAIAILTLNIVLISGLGIVGVAAGMASSFAFYFVMLLVMTVAAMKASERVLISKASSI